MALDLLLMRGRDGDTTSRAREHGPQPREKRTPSGQEQEADILAEAPTHDRERSGHRRRRTLLVVAGDGWHRGVIGIVASKLAELYSKPTIVLSVDDGLAHGSARSIPAFDLLGALESVRGRLHPSSADHRQAAGMTHRIERIGELRRRSRPSRNDRLGPEDFGAAPARSIRRWGCARFPAT